jgi:hypothetical protein
MISGGGAVFVFTQDGDLTVFASVDEAAEWLEATDVADGEYDALFTMDGSVVDARSQDQQVILSVTEMRDERALQQRLRDYQRRVGLHTSPEDPRAVANELLRLEWERRWPRRPAWLSRRLHGDGPPQI